VGAWGDLVPQYFCQLPPVQNSVISTEHIIIYNYNYIIGFRKYYRRGFGSPK